jgi:hypothetical protein
MSIEAGVLIDVSGNPIYWHVPKGASAVELPDSASLWSKIWDNRQRLRGFAHTHPGSGLPSPSSADLTTFAAIEAGLGRRLDWWILTKDCAITLYWNKNFKKYMELPWCLQDHVLAPWIWELRKRSL